MNKKPGTSKDAAGKLVRGIKRKTRKHYSSEEKIRIVLAGAAGPIRTSLRKDRMVVPYDPQRPRHSARAAARFFLKLALEEGLHSELKWLKTEAWTAADICELRASRNRCIARSSRRNGRHEFPTKLFSQRPVAGAVSSPLQPGCPHSSLVAAGRCPGKPDCD